MMLRKRWKIRKDGRWTWGSILAPLVLTLIASQDPFVTVQWPEAGWSIPEEVEDRFSDELHKRYQGDWTMLPFTRVARLSHIVALGLLTDPEDCDFLFTWMDRQFQHMEGKTVYLIAHPCYVHWLSPIKTVSSSSSSSQAHSEAVAAPTQSPGSAHDSPPR